MLVMPFYLAGSWTTSRSRKPRCFGRMSTSSPAWGLLSCRDPKGHGVSWTNRWKGRPNQLYQSTSNHLLCTPGSSSTALPARYYDAYTFFARWINSIEVCVKLDLPGQPPEGHIYEIFFRMPVLCDFVLGRAPWRAAQLSRRGLFVDGIGNSIPYIVASNHETWRLCSGPAPSPSAFLELHGVHQFLGFRRT